MAGNNIVTKTVNQIIYKTDDTGYNRALKQIQNIRKEWLKTNAVMAKAAAKTKNGLSAQLKEMQRLRDLENKLNNSSGKNNKNRKGYGSQGRAGARTNAEARAQRLRDFIIRREQRRAAQRNAQSDLIGPPRPPSASDRARVERQNRNMAGQRAAERDAAQRAAQRQALADRAREAAQARQNRLRTVTRANEVIGNTSTRLQSRYGANFGNQLGGAQLARLNQELRTGAISAARYRTSVAALEAQFRSANASASGLGGSLKGLRSSMVGLTGAYTAFSGLKSIQSEGQFFQGLNATMAMTSKGPEQAADRLQFLREQVLRLGVDYKTAAQGFTQMSVSAEGQLDESQLRGLFQGYSEYATALQIDPVKYQRGITAIQQMLGKGVIMSEELKSQLAEGVAGSMQVFVKASQKFFKDDTIDVSKMQDLMKKGLLKAKDILPLVAKEFGMAATKGGALELALKSNRVAMQRLNTTWDLFQNQIFTGKLEETLTEIYNGLTKILNWNMNDAGTGIGRVFGNIIEGAWDTFAAIHDAFVLADIYIKHYAKKIGISAGDIGKSMDWALWAVGAGTFLYTISKIFKVLYAIVGLRAGLAAVASTIGLGTGAAAAGTGAAATGGSAVPWIAAATAGYFGSTFVDEKLKESTKDRDDDGLLYNFISGTLGRALPIFGFSKNYNEMTSDKTPPLPNSVKFNDAYNSANHGAGVYNPEAQKVDVTVKVSEEGIIKIVDEIIINHDQQTLNLLTPQ